MTELHSVWKIPQKVSFYHTGAKTNSLSKNYQEFDVLKMWILVKNEVLKMWILWKMGFWNCEFCEKWDFEIANFVKNEILKLRILWKTRV